MQEIRYAMVDGEKVPVLISDENEALQAAKAARRAIVGLWREDGKENEWCADTLITVSYTHLTLPTNSLV